MKKISMLRKFGRKEHPIKGKPSTVSTSSQAIFIGLGRFPVAKENFRAPWTYRGQSQEEAKN